MATETKIQAFVHALEEGGWVSRIRTVLLLAGIAALYTIVILNQFKGLSHEKGMDQAQVGRQIADGHGFTTKFIRPLAYGQFVRHGGFPEGDVPDTYNAPLNPFVDSLLLRMTRKTWEMTEKDIVYTSDRVIAGASLLFFIISVFVNYFVAKRLFDRRLALFGMWLVLLCDVYWSFSQTGLPQNLMVLIFSLVNYCLVRAVENRDDGRNALLWLGLSGVGFGLLVLAHGLAIWIFIGALVYLSLAFWPDQGAWWMRLALHPAWIPLLIVLAMEGPWLFRLYHLTGDPFGVARFSAYDGLLGSESQVMRFQSLDVTGLSLSWFRAKIQAQTVAQLSSIYSYLGHSPIAPIFFVAILHLFKRKLTASFRWCVLWMWLFAMLGMSIFGLPEVGPMHANDLHMLFVPMMTFYGMAFVLVLWTRLSAERPQANLLIVRLVALISVYLVAAFPLVNIILTAAERPQRVQWPPYIPPYVAILRQWTNPDEILSSDMPWAVAWYADRKCVWLPSTIAEFIDMEDYQRLHAPIVGMYLTPISGDARFLSDIAKGEYKEWSPLILRNLNAKEFPLQSLTGMPIDNECIFYADRNRWNAKSE